MTTFNLSEKIECYRTYLIVPVKDIREFIRLLKEVLREDGYAGDDVVLRKIDKLAGEKLIK